MDNCVDLFMYQKLKIFQNIHLILLTIHFVDNPLKFFYCSMLDGFLTFTVFKHLLLIPNSNYFYIIPHLILIII